MRGLKCQNTWHLTTLESFPQQVGECVVIHRILHWDTNLLKCFLWFLSDCVIHVPWDQSDTVYVQTLINKQKTLTNRLICRLIVTPNDQGTQVSAPPKAPHTSTSMAWTASSSYIISAPRDGHSSLRDPQRCQNVLGKQVLAPLQRMLS